jgi:hypothetical protein
MTDIKKKKPREIDDDLAQLEAALSAAYGGDIEPFEPFEPFEQKEKPQEEKQEEKSS